MDDISVFLSPQSPSLKICGITSASDAEKLATKKVPALGINFWPKSKRYCPPDNAITFLPSLKEKIIRVGVFVNNAQKLAPELFEKDLLDIVQLHGDESDEEALLFLNQGIPVIRSLALSPDSSLSELCAHYQKLSQNTAAPLALLLDTHAPGLYGGTGQTIDWQQAATFIRQCSPLPVLLAGGIKPNNAKDAIEQTHPAGLDIASGAEISPGIKDFKKVNALLDATNSSLSK